MSEALRNRLYEKGWQYVPHDKTDIRVLFNRVRAEQAKSQPAKPSNVAPIKRKAQ